MVLPYRHWRRAHEGSAIRPKVLLVLCCIALPAIAQADAGLQLFLEETLAAAREKDQLPAVAALVQIDGRIEAEAALGVRALGHPEKVALDDRWHIGSDTKAFTSTMIARLVERHVMSLDDTLATAFPSLAQDMDPAYRNVTVTQLLSHTAGLPALTDDKELPEFLAVIQTAEGVREQRAAIARNYLTKPPASKSGEFAYSNIGFIIAGAIAEARTGKTWEQLIRELVFEPLGIRNAGFGVPGNAGRVDEPWGHEEVAGKLVPIDPARVDADNPLALGPDGVPLLLTHSGSNGFWVADIRIMPLHDMIFLTVTNAGNEAANEAVQDIGKPLKDRLKPFE